MTSHDNFQKGILCSLAQVHNRAESLLNHLQSRLNTKIEAQEAKIRVLETKLTTLETEIEAPGTKIKVLESKNASLELSLRNLIMKHIASENAHKQELGDLKTKCQVQEANNEQRLMLLDARMKNFDSPANSTKLSIKRKCLEHDKNPRSDTGDRPIKPKARRTCFEHDNSRRTFSMTLRSCGRAR